MSLREPLGNISHKLEKQTTWYMRKCSYWIVVVDGKGKNIQLRMLSLQYYCKYCTVWAVFLFCVIISSSFNC